MKLLEDLFGDFIMRLWRKYRLESVFLIISLILVLGAIIMLILSSKEPKALITIEKENRQGEQLPTIEKIVVDISGAVESPDAYRLDRGTRLKGILVEAGGLSANADREYFARNYNLARKLIDQEKIYIPSEQEIINGLFTEKRFVREGIRGAGELGSSSERISLNYATSKELETLPGVGPVTAEKIIKARPYSKISDLLEKKVLGKGAYEKIKEKIIAR